MHRKICSHPTRALIKSEHAQKHHEQISLTTFIPNAICTWRLRSSSELVLLVFGYKSNTAKSGQGKTESEIMADIFKPDDNRPFQVRCSAIPNGKFASTAEEVIVRVG